MDDVGADRREEDAREGRRRRGRRGVPVDAEYGAVGRLMRTAATGAPGAKATSPESLGNQSLLCPVGPHPFAIAAKALARSNSGQANADSSSEPSATLGIDPAGRARPFPAHCSRTPCSCPQAKIAAHGPRPVALHALPDYSGRNSLAARTIRSPRAPFPLAFAATTKLPTKQQSCRFS